MSHFNNNGRAERREIPVIHLSQPLQPFLRGAAD
jgi:hypothetical protein